MCVYVCVCVLTKMNSKTKVRSVHVFSKYLLSTFVLSVVPGAEKNSDELDRIEFFFSWSLQMIGNSDIKQ